MVVGPKVTKFTYLLDVIEVTGTVASWNDPAKGALGDGFGLAVDSNYEHLPRSVGHSGNILHCETYPLPADQINHDVPWLFPQKPDDQPFKVLSRSTGQQRELQVNDHIRLIGRPVIENGHPQQTSLRGLLQIGYVFLELHPFNWGSLELVEPETGDAEITRTLAIAAPLYNMVYGGQWAANNAAGVADHLFLGDNGSEFHNDVTANCEFTVPGTDADGPVFYLEEIVENGTGQSLDNVRTITPTAKGIRVIATVAAPPKHKIDSVVIADINDPAESRSIFVAKYTTARHELHPRNVLLPGEPLPTGDQLQSANQKVRLVMQADGNLVEYTTTNGVMWASNTVRSWGFHVAWMQRDGDFELYDDHTGEPIWSTQTAGNPDSYLALQDDGDIVVNSAAGATLWSSGVILADDD